MNRAAEQAGEVGLCRAAQRVEVRVWRRGSQQLLQRALHGLVRQQQRQRTAQQQTRERQLQQLLVHAGITLPHAPNQRKGIKQRLHDGNV